MKNNSLALPEIIQALINSQNNRDSVSFAACFAEQAEVTDEGKHHVGRAAIKTWNEYTNTQYHTQTNPLDYKPSGTGTVLAVDVSGNFAGSPIVLYYHLVIENELIKQLAIQSN